MTFNPTHIVAHYGEIALKGKNQSDFMNRLYGNIHKKLNTVQLSWKIFQPHGYFLIEVPPEESSEIPAALSVLNEVIGLVWFAPARKIAPDEVGLLGDNPDLTPLEDVVVSLAEETFSDGQSFAVRSTRSEKRFALKSPEIDRHIGQIIIDQTPWNSVNLDHPDVTFHVEVTPEGIYVYGEKIRAFGGLPAGVTGKVLTLLSGGIDSPAAAFLAAKRGCSVDFIHFTAEHVSEDNAHEYKVSKLAQSLSRYTLESRLYLVPYTHFEFTLFGHKIFYELMIFRRFMARTAEVLAESIDAQALVTGDNLAQVASQTLENLVANSKAVDIPILRPLITYDKMEIVDLAEKIGTYDLSLQPYKDCCSIVAKNPKTSSEDSRLESLEGEIFGDYEEVIQQTINEAIVLEYSCGELVSGAVPDAQTG